MKKKFMKIFLEYIFSFILVTHIYNIYILLDFSLKIKKRAHLIFSPLLKLHFTQKRLNEAWQNKVTTKNSAETFENLIIFEIWIEEMKSYRNILSSSSPQEVWGFPHHLHIFSYACFSLLSSCVFLVLIVIWSHCVKTKLRIFLQFYQMWNLIRLQKCRSWVNSINILRIHYYVHKCLLKLHSRPERISISNFSIYCMEN